MATAASAAMPASTAMATVPRKELLELGPAGDRAQDRPLSARPASLPHPPGHVPGCVWATRGGSTRFPSPPQLSPLICAAEDGRVPLRPQGQQGGRPGAPLVEAPQGPRPRAETPAPRKVQGLGLLGEATSWGALHLETQAPPSGRCPLPGAPHALPLCPVLLLRPFSDLHVGARGLHPDCRPSSPLLPPGQAPHLGR